MEIHNALHDALPDSAGGVGTTSAYYPLSTTMCDGPEYSDKLEIQNNPK